MSKIENLTQISFSTSIGTCKLIFSKNGIRKFLLPYQLNCSDCDFSEKLSNLYSYTKDEYKYYNDLISRIRMYFIGYRVSLNDDLDYGDAGNFCKSVWQVTRSVPYGETRSYKWIASQLNCNNVRVIGWALNRNPAPIFVPCHRIIKDNGEIGGFKWGIKTKEYLLRLENDIHKSRIS